MTDPTIEAVLISLRRIIRATDIHSRNLIKTSGLTAPQLLILQALVRTPYLSISELARELILGQATVSIILDRLESRDLIQRRKSEQDKRRTELSLTETGRLAVTGAPLPLQDRFVDSFTALEDWEQTHILSALQRVAQMMDARDLDAAPVLDVGSLDRSEET
ncbi:MAG TPA: MarR family transcriptional regulator [Pseudomonadaceae bacterium]|nr:MarR family transcriptional regulator [Pseudomonadaceae bacterium]